MSETPTPTAHTYSRPKKAAGRRLFRGITDPWAAVQKAEHASEETGSRQQRDDGAAAEWVNPPYNPTTLLGLVEAVPIHASAIHQKALDAVGRGVELRPRRGVDTPSDAEHDLVTGWLDEANPTDPITNELVRWVTDRAAVGYGALEVTRDATGRPAQLHYLPAHTIRRHRDGVRLGQRRGTRLVWFKLFGHEQDVDFATGRVGDVPWERRATEILWIDAPGPRSSYYGVPDWISGIGDIALLAALRDYNLQWFNGYTVPDLLIALLGGTFGKAADDLLDHLEGSEPGRPHGAYVMDVQGIEQGARLEVERLNEGVKEGSFTKLADQVAQRILIAHRTPPYRIGWPIVGGLGGNVGHELNQIYRDGVVTPLQVDVAYQLNRVLRDLGVEDWTARFSELDFRDEEAEIRKARLLIGSRLATLGEARERLGDGPYPQELAELHNQVVSDTNLRTVEEAEAGGEPVKRSRGGVEAQAAAAIQDVQRLALALKESIDEEE